MSGFTLTPHAIAIIAASITPIGILFASIGSHGLRICVELREYWVWYAVSILTLLVGTLLLTGSALSITHLLGGI